MKSINNFCEMDTEDLGLKGMREHFDILHSRQTLVLLVSLISMANRPGACIMIGKLLLHPVRKKFVHKLPEAIL